ncbi:MAG: prepilin-type N-terminal cleavage/methylation domain-containing protein, partial [candidate division NC10 bacterium]
MRDRKDRTIRSQGEGGFTLAEVLVATTLSTMVLLGVYLLYDVNQATFIRGEQRTDLQQNARIGMDRLVRELRLAGSDPAIIPLPCA